MTSLGSLSADRVSDSSATNARPVRRGGKLYFIATAMAQVIALLRYVALARLLGPRELGLAATLVVTGAFFDMISDTGSDRFLIQDREGNDPHVQKLVQLVYFGRGAAIAAAMVVLAVPLAGFYREPRLAAGFAIFALVPLLQGCQHLDLRRQQRHQDFRTESIAILVGEVASFAAMLIAAYLTRSYTAILWGLIARAALLALISHLRAERRYGWSYQAEVARRLWHYSTPLMATGLLLFIGSQADRVLIGRELGFRDLGQYSAILLLVFYPCGVLLRYTHNLYLPLIAAPRDNPAERDRVSDAFGGLTFSLGILMAAGFAVVAPPVIGLLYGNRYTAPALLVGLIGVLQTTRFLINWPTTVAMSMGRSRTVLMNNLPRVLIFPGALIGLWTIGGLIGVVIGLTAAEAVSIVTSLILLNRNTDRPWTAGFDLMAMYVGTAGLIAAWNLALPRGSVATESGLLLLSAGVAIWFYRRERETLRQAWVLVSRAFRNARRAAGSTDPAI